MVHKLTAVIALSALLMGGANASQLAKVLERGVLEIAAYRAFPPFSYKGDDGRSYGVDVDLARALAAEIGVAGAIRLVGVDENMGDDLRNNVWKGHYIGGGTADVMMHVPHDAAYAEEEDKVAFLSPYYRDELVLAFDARLGDPDVMQFTSEKVGVELDTLADFYLLSAVDGKVRDNVVHYSNLREAGVDLAAGRIAAIYGPRAEVEDAVRQHGKAFPIKSLTIPGFTRTGWDLGIGVKQKNRELARALGEAMEKLRASGKIRAIFESHGLSYVPPKSAAN